MPSRPPRPCAVHGWILINNGAGCSECNKRPAPLRQKDTRPGANQRGYGPDHQRKRDALIKRIKYCQDPYGLHKDQKVNGTIRDHVIPLNKGGNDDESKKGSN